MSESHSSLFHRDPKDATDSAKLKTQSEILKQNTLAKLKLAKGHVLRITKSPAAVQITAESD